jgi:glucan phosphoethanolaminetransferase (alkaline phosphatase superfamily)
VKRTLIVLTLLVALVTGVLAPRSASPASAAPAASHAASVHTHANSAAFDKTRFVLHLAFAAFLIHYIYKKYKEHKLGGFRHIVTDIKAAAAALLAYHEIKVSYDIAKTSKSKTLQLLIAPINKLVNGFNDLKSRLAHGDTSTLNSLNAQQGGLQTLAGKYGFGFKDKAPSGFSNF